MAWQTLCLVFFVAAGKRANAAERDEISCYYNWTHGCVTEDFSSKFHAAVMISGTFSSYLSDEELSKHNWKYFYSRLGGRVSSILCDGKGDTDIAGKLKLIDYTNQYPRMESCYLEARELETEYHYKFTHFIRTRPDIEWKAPMTSLLHLPSDYVSVRARIAIFSPPRMVPDDSFSWHRNGPKNHFPSCYPETIPDGHLYGITQCALLDDQFFVAPEHLASALFLRNTEEALPITEATTRSYGINRSAFRGSAFKAHKGQPPPQDFYLRTCEPILGNVFRKWQESFLTKHFVQRNVPYQITPFSFRLRHEHYGPFPWTNNSTIASSCGIIEENNKKRGL